MPALNDPSSGGGFNFTTAGTGKVSTPKLLQKPSLLSSDPSLRNAAMQGRMKKTSAPAPAPQHHSSNAPQQMHTQSSPAPTHSASAPTHPAAATPPQKLPTFDQWAMKDSAYQQAISAYNLALSNAQTAHDANIAAANQDQTNQINDWQTQYDRGSQSMLDDFASRGLGNSGLYADARAKYTSDAEAQKQSLLDAIMRRIQGEDTSLTGTQTDIQAQIQAAKQAAAARGAGQYSGTV